MGMKGSIPSRGYSFPASGGAFLGFFVAAWLMSLTGFNPLDEAWTMQVIHRVQAGETLYRDVFFGVTPLSIWIGLSWASLFGGGLVSLKALAAVQFAAGAALVLDMARRCEIRGSSRVAIALALLGSAWNPHASLYPGLANLCSLASLAALMRIRESEIRGVNGSLLWAGVFAGLAFAAKQTIGIFVLGAALGSLPLLGLGFRAALPLSGAFLLGALLPLFPVAWQGGLPGLWEYGFAGKGLYLRSTSFQYMEELRGVRYLLNPGTPMNWFRKGVVGLSFVLPPLSLALWLLPRRGRGSHKTAVDLVGCNTLAALAGIFPIAGVYHLSFALPQCILLLFLALVLDHPVARSPNFSWRRWFLGMTWACVLLLAVGRCAGGALRALGRTAQPSRLPFFSGIPPVPAIYGDIEFSLRQLVGRVRGQPVFILSHGASAWYLASGLRNPTAYDLPMIPAFGRYGESRIQSRIEKGEIPWVAIRRDPGSGTPSTEKIEDWIRRNMTPRERAGEFELFGLPLRHSQAEGLVPGAGIEPARLIQPRDFKSRASASSATRAP